MNLAQSEYKVAKTMGKTEEAGGDSGVSPHLHYTTTPN